MTTDQSALATRRALLNVGAAALLWALIPTLLFPNPPLDVVIVYGWSRDLALGYTQHPPLLSWIFAGASTATGGFLGIVYWLSGLSIALGYWCIWTLGGRLGLAPEQRLVAILINSATFYATQPLPEFNHNVIQIPIWLGLTLLFHRALTGGRWLDWLALGALAGLGLITKYSVVLMIGAIGLYALSFADGRRHLLTLRPYAAALLAILIVLPHAVWIVETDFLTFRYAADRSVPATGALDHLLHPLDFLFAQIGALAPSLLVVAALLWPRWANHQQPAQAAIAGGFADAAARRFVWWFLLVPLAAVLAGSLITGAEFRHMWGMPMFGLLGIAIAGTLAAGPVRLHWPSILGAAILIQGIFLTVIVGQAAIEPLWKTKPSRIHYPGPEIARIVTQAWREETGRPLAIVAGDTWEAGNVSIHSADRPSMFFLHNYEQTPWVSPERVAQSGVLAIWRGAPDAPPAFVTERYPGLVASGTARVPQQTWVDRAPPVEISWAIIEPPDALLADPAPDR